MQVDPAPEPTPALKHRLVLRQHQLKPGNAATHYMRSLAENGLGGHWKNVRKRFGEAVDEWYGNSVPIDQLPLDDVRTAVAEFGDLVELFIRRGAERKTCDWGYELNELRGTDVISFLLPAVQESRGIARAVSLHTRLAIAEGEHDKAIDYMRINYRLGLDVAKGETLVNGLVGIAICGMTTQNLIDLIGEPGSPNLYWALTELPKPMIDLRPAVRLEVSLGSRMVPTIENAEQAQHSPREWARLLTKSITEIQDSVIVHNGGLNVAINKNETAMGLFATSWSLVIYPGAKARLIESGMDPEVVEQMPVGQVLFVDTGREWSRIADATEKWWYVPYREAQAGMNEADEMLSNPEELIDNYGGTMARLLLPAISSAREAQMRLEWQMDAVRVVEALRMHAAEEGRFPRSLDDVTCVPVPKNLVTGKHYQYKLREGVAVLELPLSDGFSVSWRFEIELNN